MTKAAVRIAGSKPIGYLHEPGHGMRTRRRRWTRAARYIDGSMGGLGGCRSTPGATEVVFGIAFLLREARDFIGIDNRKVRRCARSAGSEMPAKRSMAAWPAGLPAGLPAAACGFRDHGLNPSGSPPQSPRGCARRLRNMFENGRLDPVTPDQRRVGGN